MSSPADIVSNVTSDDDFGCGDGSILDQPFIRFTIISLYLIVFFVCLIGNLFAIIVICLHKSMRTSTNFFLGNLALADLLVAVFCILQNMFHIVGTNGSWFFGEVICKLYVFFLHLVPCAVIGILVCVSLEKYIAVLHPLLALKLLTSKFRGIMMAGIWIISLTVNLPYYFTTIEIRYENARVCARNIEGSMIGVKTMVTISFIFWFCLPLIIMAILYSRIGMVLWKSSLRPLEVRYLNDSAGNHNVSIEALEPLTNGNLNTVVSRTTSTDEHNQQQQHAAAQSDMLESRKKVIRLLIAIVCCFGILTFPYHLRLVLVAYETQAICNNQLEVLTQPLVYLLLFMSMSINPILYAFMSKRFRNATKELLSCRAGVNRKSTRTRTICSEAGSRSPSLQARVLRTN